MAVVRFCLFGLAMGMELALGQCPAKISTKLCHTFMTTADTAYLQVRIVLDASQEDPAFFDKSKPIRERPLRTWTEELISEYDLRQLNQPESGYVRPYTEIDLVPARDQVIYHNTSVTKVNLSNLLSKPYVATVEPACWRMSVALCTDINTRPDSAAIFFRIYFSAVIKLDTAARKNFLAAFALRDTTLTLGTAGRVCMGSGFIASPPTIRAVGKNSEIHVMEPGSINCPLQLNPVLNQTLKRAKHFHHDPLSKHRLDGRALHMNR